MDRRSPSLAARAVLALALMVGFYVVAIGIAFGLLYIPYAEAVYANRLHLKLALFCIVGAGVILWSIVPRPDRFTAPGPMMSSQDQPKLFPVIREVAAASGQAMPVEVYLAPDVNAWVTQRGGVMGFGSRRVMGLGLPLLQILTVSELRAVLAHEFGHYHGGDTKLGPWIYKTRAAIGRTLQGLAGHSSILQKPFVWYGMMFLRVSHAVSRRQEFTADELAATTVGSRPLVEGLKKIHGAALAYSGYWSSEVEPVLRAGFLPPIADGFQRFVAAKTVATALSDAVERAMQEPESDPYDTHPPLRDRVNALRALPEGGQFADEPPAITLMAGVQRLEGELLLDTVAGAVEVRRLTPVEWNEVGDRVYIPMWEAWVQSHGADLLGHTIDSIAEEAGTLRDAVANVRATQDEERYSAEAERIRNRISTLGAAFALALTRLGWSIRAQPGEPILMRGPSGTIDPFRTVQALASGELDATAWRTRCVELGTVDVSMTRGGPQAGRGQPKVPTLAAGEARPAHPRLVLIQEPQMPRRPTSVQCWRCKEPLPVTDENRAKTTRCPKCKTRQQLPT